MSGAMPGNSIGLAPRRNRYDPIAPYRTPRRYIIPRLVFPEESRNSTYTDEIALSYRPTSFERLEKHATQPDKETIPSHLGGACILARAACTRHCLYHRTGVLRTAAATASVHLSELIEAGPQALTSPASVYTVSSHAAGATCPIPQVRLIGC